LLACVIFMSSSFFIETTASEIACEKVGDFFHKFSPYSNRHAIYKTCFMNKTSVINSTDSTISKLHDESIARLDFFTNQNIVYLPINVNENFPKLAFYNAQNCSVKSISKENFNGLFELKKLYLDNNEITKIASDTFNDLVLLEWLTLGRDVFSLSLKTASFTDFN
jgi:Leucine-rich repeat (LRR) protein